MTAAGRPRAIIVTGGSRGVGAATAVVMLLFAVLLAVIILRRESLDYKTSLQELTASEMSTMPIYSVTDTGPDHAKEFTAIALVADEALVEGTGRSKKEAEQAAARQAFRAHKSRLYDETTPAQPTPEMKERS